MSEPVRHAQPAVALAGAESPGSRVVLLGASNVRLAFPVIVSLLDALAPPPVEIFAACGHGRSYGLTTRVLGCEMPSIGDCGLWTALAASPPRATTALIADVGNDIMYGVPLDTIAGWIERDVARLAQHGASLTIARMPLASIEKLPEWRYRVLRSLLYPTRQLTFDEVRANAHELDQRLRAIAGTVGGSLVEPSAEWYGIDPIHVRKSSRTAAWSSIVATLLARTDVAAPGVLAEPDRHALSSSRPATRKMFGVEQSSAQPAVRLASGTTVALY